MHFDVSNVRVCSEVLARQLPNLSGQSRVLPNQLSSYPPPPFCLSPLPYILCHLPTYLYLSTTCRRLNVQCDLDNSHVVVQSLALRFSSYSTHRSFPSPLTLLPYPHSSLLPGNWLRRPHPLYRLDHPPSTNHPHQRLRPSGSPLPVSSISRKTNFALW
jgi:hypothetical protein